MNIVKLTIVAIWVVFSLGYVNQQALADEELGNQTVVRSSEYGGSYAKSIPAEGYGQKGVTRVYLVREDKDELAYEFPWYAQELYLGGAGEHSLIRFGPWHRGKELSDKHLAIGIYYSGKTLREYSTLEIFRLASGVSEEQILREFPDLDILKIMVKQPEFGKNISMSVSHYNVFGRRIGFRWVDGNDYVYEVEGVNDNIFTFDLTTGDVTVRDIKKQDSQ